MFSLKQMYLNNSFLQIIHSHWWDLVITQYDHLHVPDTTNQAILDSVLWKNTFGDINCYRQILA